MKPKFLQRVTQAYNVLRPTRNSGSLRAARDFLRFGSGRDMRADWSQVIMAPQDNYTGYMYGAIDIRAVSSTKIGEYYLKTKAKPEVAEQAKKKEEEVVHPYIELIDESKTFSNFDFWYDNSTYLDLMGCAYILVIRNVNKGLVGNIQEFKILKPYFVQRIFDANTKELLGYKEHKGGMVRDIPKEMIIPIIKLHPFSHDETYSTADAAKDHQFTLKSAGDYTRSAIRGNTNAPGIIGTDRELEGEELANFKSRVMGHVKGEPLFAGGKGALTWQDMQVDLNKAALKDVNSISLNNLISVTGASKTMLGIEESGTTKDTSKTQKDNFIDYRSIPIVQKIIDALNQDYKNYYPNDYAKTKFKMYIDNPLLSDRDSELKDVDIRSRKQEVYNTLVNKGYDHEIAAKYAEGTATLMELGEPTNEPIQVGIPENQAAILLKQEKNELTIKHEVESTPKEPLEVVDNQADTGLLRTTQASLQNSIVNIDERMIAEISQRLGKVENDLKETDLLTERQRKEYENELELVLMGFYGIILPLFAYNVLSKRAESYGKLVPFKMNNEVRSFIKDIASKAARSHIETTLDSVYKFAQEQALKGVGRDQIVRDIINKYGAEISKSRASLIAQTETNRAFTMSQFQADKQFIKQGGYEGQAYKQWVTRSDNPCGICLNLASQPPIPFDQNFADIGDELTGTELKDGKTIVRKMTVGFADLEAGNAHPRCFCDYDLIIREN